MNRKAAIALVLAAAVLATPLTAARAQQYYVNPYYANNPIFWPVLLAGAVLGTAALIATLPIRLVCSNCLPPPEGFYPLYETPVPPPPSGPPMSYTPAR